jgi:hypothetical protein
MPGLIPFGPNSQVFFVDAANGNNVNDGLTPSTAVASVATAYAKTTSGNNDVIFFIPSGTADNPAATLTWSNSYTHLIGLGPELRGMGNRCRIEGLAATDLTSLITVSGSGCVFSGIKWINLADADVDSGAMTVSGGRNSFIDCQISGMGHATPGARAGSYSLTLTGEENNFKRCTIGLDTIVRAAANAELVVASGAVRNTFEQCSFESASETAGKFLVMVTALDRWLKFIDCDFYNFSDNHATTLTEVFNLTGATGTYHIRMLGNNTSIGFTGWADTVTYIQSAGPAANAGWGLATAPTT